MGVSVQNSDLRGYAQKTSVFPENTRLPPNVVCLISVSYKSLFLLTSSAENSPELMKIFHLRPLQSSLKSALFPAEYLSSHFLIFLQRSSSILPCSLGVISVLKANILLAHGPSTLLKTVQQKICQGRLCLKEKFQYFIFKN